MIEVNRFLVQLSVSEQKGLLQVLDCEGRTCVLACLNDMISVIEPNQIYNGKNFIAYLSFEVR